MGRGRARAKQTKVARDLKYRTIETDFSSLERELRGQRADDSTPVDDDPYAEYVERYADVDENDYGRQYG